MTPSRCIHHVPHTWCNEPIWWHLTQRTQMRHRHEHQQHLQALVLATGQKKHAHQWQLTGARMKIVWKIKAVKCLTSYTEGPDPMEQVTRCHHRRNKHEPPYERLMTLLGMSMRIHHTRGGFILPCIPLHLFISAICQLEREREREREINYSAMRVFI